MTPNQVLASALFALLIVVSPAAADVPSVGVDSPAADSVVASGHQLDENWLDGENSLTLAHVERLVAMAQLDPQTATILQDAKDVLGAQTTRQLVAFIHICEPNPTGDYSGLADVQAFRRLVSKSLDEQSGKERVDHRKQIESMLPKNERITKLENQPDYVTALTAVRGGICVIAGSNLRDAYSTFIHELTHIAYLVPQVEDMDFLDLYKNAQEYVDKTFVVPGGELEASIQGYRALIRTAHSRYGLPDEIRESFNDQGELVDRKKFSAYLLGKGRYGDLLRENYSRKLIGLYNLLASKESFLTDVYNERAGYSRKRLSPEQHRLVIGSAHRLQSEIIGLRELRQSYLSRMAAEGISVKVSN